MKRLVLLLLFSITLLMAACNRGDHLNQPWETPAQSLITPSAVKSAELANASEDLNDDTAAQDLLELIDQLIQANQAGDPFNDLP